MAFFNLVPPAFEILGRPCPRGRKQGPNGPITHSYQFLLSLGVFPENLSSIGALLLFGAPRDLELPQVTLTGPGHAQCGSKGPLTHSNQFLWSWSVFPQSLSPIGAKIAQVHILGPKKGGHPKIRALGVLCTSVRPKIWISIFQIGPCATFLKVSSKCTDRSAQDLVGGILDLSGYKYLYILCFKSDFLAGQVCLYQ